MIYSLDIEKCPLFNEIYPYKINVIGGYVDYTKQLDKDENTTHYLVASHGHMYDITEHVSMKLLYASITAKEITEMKMDANFIYFIFDNEPFHNIDKLLEGQEKNIKKIGNINLCITPYEIDYLNVMGENLAYGIIPNNSSTRIPIHKFIKILEDNNLKVTNKNEFILEDLEELLLD